MAHRGLYLAAIAAVATVGWACQSEHVELAGEGVEGGSGSASLPTGGLPNRATGGRNATAGAPASGGETGVGGNEPNGGRRLATGGRATGGEMTGGRATGGETTGGRATGGEMAGGAGGDPTGGTPSGGAGGEPTGGANAGGDGGENGGSPPCVVPSYSSDCSQVPYFQCGVEFSCEGSVAHMKWHEHILCEGTEQIVHYSCTYPCVDECDPLGTPWPDSGETLVEEACVGPGESSRRVFVTSTAMAGDFGGVAAGDQLCQGLADAEKLGGKWKAWLSDENGSPATTFQRSQSGYIDLAGNVVAWSWDRLIDYVIIHDQTGTQIDSDAMVWTGTDEAGNALAEHCSNWQSTSGTGAVGHVNGSVDWTSATAQDCSAPAHLYCFEQ